ncbi:alpha/beta hydrolase [Georgenia sp. Z1344]|uniref:alpha/beta fold hydrolase n=1 Tax=Georgenia sp. Z1344 TaxID=3416706 RepID=UPI003CE7AE14
MSRSPVRSDVAVTGGALAVHTWEAPSKAPTVVAVHGVTSSHAAWAWLADALPDVRVVAPDLRGRGRSSGLGGPYGMAAHTDDLAAVLRGLDDGPHLVVGHSMGAFVSLVLAHRHPDLVAELVLVDGGLPLRAPEGIDPQDAMDATLGPAADRLRATFADRAGYRDFWRDHPAFAGVEDERFDAYTDHDLEPTPDGRLRPATAVEALHADQVELVGGTSVREALDALDPAARPTTFVHAPRGLLDAEPLYTADEVHRWSAELPGVHVVWSLDTNHYTVVMSDRGATDLAEILRPALEGALR